MKNLFLVLLFVFGLSFSEWFIKDHSETITDSGRVVITATAIGITLAEAKTFAKQKILAKAEVISPWLVLASCWPTIIKKEKKRVRRRRGRRKILTFYKVKMKGSFYDERK